MSENKTLEDASKILAKKHLKTPKIIKNISNIKKEHLQYECETCAASR
jgi:hypothetical protein